MTLKPPVATPWYAIRRKTPQAAAAAGVASAAEVYIYGDIGESWYEETIFHPTEEMAPGLASGYADAISAYRGTLPEQIQMLFDRFHFFDLAFKVVGVGSVGTQCGVGLFMAADDDPLFLQVKEARASVLEPYAGKSLHPNHGQRVVVGQRKMQAASDLFLGWVRGKDGRDRYIRQLRDMKMSAVIEDWDEISLRHYGRMCAHALARAHARSGDRCHDCRLHGIRKDFR